MASCGCETVGVPVDLEKSWKPSDAEERMRGMRTSILGVVAFGSVLDMKPAYASDEPHRHYDVMQWLINKGVR